MFSNIYPPCRRYHLHESVFWLATHPLDARPGQWQPDPIKHAWVCQADGARLPGDPAGVDEFLTDYRRVKTVGQCGAVVAHWADPGMQDPDTRTRLDTGSKTWDA